MTIQDVIDEMAQEVGGSTSDADLEAILFVCFKAGLRRVGTYLLSRTFFLQGSVTLSSGAYEVSLSTLSGFIKERAVWYLDSNNVRVPIYPHLSVQTFHNNFSPNQYGKPARYLVYNKDMIQFDRRSDSDLTIGLDYQKSISGVSLGDTFLGDEQMLEVAKSFGYERYYRNYEEDKTKADDNLSTGRDVLLQLEGDYEAEETGGYVEFTDF